MRTDVGVVRAIAAAARRGRQSSSRNCRVTAHRGSGGHVEAMAREVQQACKAVAAIPMRSRDAPGIFLRWSAWLMRNLVGG